MPHPTIRNVWRVTPWVRQRIETSFDLRAVPIETLSVAAQVRYYRDTFCGRSKPFLSRHFFCRSRPFLSRHLRRPIRAAPFPSRHLFVAAQGRAYRDTLSSGPLLSRCFSLAPQSRSHRDTFCGRSRPFLSRHILWPLGAVPIDTLLGPSRASKKGRSPSRHFWGPSGL